jgi:hypothetical protein
MLRSSAAWRTVRSCSGSRSFARKSWDTNGTNPASQSLAGVPFSGWAGRTSSMLSRVCAPVPGSANPRKVLGCRSGPGGRRFESCLPDQFSPASGRPRERRARREAEIARLHRGSHWGHVQRIRGCVRAASAIPSSKLKLRYWMTSGYPRGIGGPSYRSHSQLTGWA